MLMSFGQFVFGMDTLAYQELQRQTQWKHRSNSRVGARDGRQYLGPGDDTFTISGVLMPDLAGTPAALDELRRMGDTGDAYVLVDGAGTVHGAYLLEGVTQNSSYIAKDGTGRRIEFSISLTRQDDDQASAMTPEGAN